jgi:hypothetical protein
VLEPVELRLTLVADLMLCALALLFAFFPRALAYPDRAGRVGRHRDALS